MASIQRIQVIDSHTGGEPTRVVVSGGPDLGGGSVADRLKVFREQHDRFRSAVVSEPRGSDGLVGGLLCEPNDKSCAASFFSNSFIPSRDALNSLAPLTRPCHNRALR